LVSAKTTNLGIWTQLREVRGDAQPCWARRKANGWLSIHTNWTFHYLLRFWRCYITVSSCE